MNTIMSAKMSTLCASASAPFKLTELMSIAPIQYIDILSRFMDRLIIGVMKVIALFAKS